MKIAVIGSGAVGSFYGMRLQQRGHDLHFLMRRDLEAVRTGGLTVHSCDEDLHLRVNAYASPDEIGPVDLVICALKTTALHKAEALVRPCVGENTDILALMNGLGVEDRFAGWFGGDRVLGGLAFVCINRGRPGIVHHYGYGRLAIGHFRDDFHHANRIADLFRDAGFETTVPPTLLQARWEKLVWNIPFSTLTVSAGSVSTQCILDDPHLRQLAVDLMTETIAAGNADGCAIDREPLIQKMLDNTATMGHYKPSMLLDYLQHRPLEVDTILGEPCRRAQKHNVPAPHLTMQYALVRHLDRLNRDMINPLNEKDA